MKERRDEGGMVSGATPIVLSAKSQHDLTVTVEEAEKTHLRLDDVGLHALQALHATHADLVVEVFAVPPDGLVFHHLHVVQPDDVENPC